MHDFQFLFSGLKKLVLFVRDDIQTEDNYGTIHVVTEFANCDDNICTIDRHRMLNITLISKLAVELPGVLLSKYCINFVIIEETEKNLHYLSVRVNQIPPVIMRCRVKIRFTITLYYLIHFLTIRPINTL